MLKWVVDRLGSFRGLEKNLVLLFIMGIIAAVALQLIQPLFPVFLLSLEASEIEISSVISLSSIAGMLLVLPAGWVMDRIGEKKMLLIGIMLWSVSTFLIAWSRNWRTVAVLYSFHGIADAFVGPARMAMISFTSAQSTEATVFGLMSLDWLIGGTLAPPVSGYFAEKIGWHVPLLAAATLFLISVIPALKLDERKSEQVYRKKGETSLSLMGEVRFSTGFMYFMFGFLTNSAQSMVATVLPLFLNNQLTMSTTIIGLFFTAANIFGVMAQVPGGLMADRYGKKKIIILLLLPIPLVYALWGILEGWYAYLFLFVLSCGLTAMMGPAILAIVSEIFPEERKGLAFGMRMAGMRLGSASGPMLGGFLYGGVGSFSPFIGAGIIFLISIPFIYFLK